MHLIRMEKNWNHKVNIWMQKNEVLLSPFNLFTCTFCHYHAIKMMFFVRQQNNAIILKTKKTWNEDFSFLLASTFQNAERYLPPRPWIHNKCMLSYELFFFHNFFFIFHLLLSVEKNKTKVLIACMIVRDYWQVPF